MSATGVLQLATMARELGPSQSATANIVSNKMEMLSGKQITHESDFAAVSVRLCGEPFPHECAG